MPWDDEDPSTDIPTNCLFATIAILLNTNFNAVADQVSNSFHRDTTIDVQNDLWMLLDKICHGRRWNGHAWRQKIETVNIPARIGHWINRDGSVGVTYRDQYGDGHTAVARRGDDGEIEYRCYENSDDGDSEGCDVTDDIDEFTSAFWFY